MTMIYDRVISRERYYVNCHYNYIYVRYIYVCVCSYGKNTWIWSNMIISYGHQGDHWSIWVGLVNCGIPAGPYQIMLFMIAIIHRSCISTRSYWYMIYMLVMLVQQEHLRPGWWFGTCFIFPYIGNFKMPTDFQWLPNLFQRGWNHQPETMPCFSWYIVYPSIHLILAPRKRRWTCWGRLLHSFA